MIVFDLVCNPAAHRFEGWFANSPAFYEQLLHGLVTCPHCGSADIAKAAMAPSLGRKSNQVTFKPAAKLPVSNETLPPAAQEMITKLAALQALALQQSTWVGDKFAAQSRAIHYGEQDPALIHGQATRAEALALAEEGIEAIPLPFPVTPPGEVN